MKAFTAAALSALVFATVNAASTLKLRQIVVHEHGTTVQPVDGAVIAPSDSFHAASTLKRRQIIVHEHGTTVQPVDGAVIAHGDNFPFEYDLAHLCFAAYDPISVYLSTDAPTTDNVNLDGTLEDGSYVFDFGQFLAPAFENMPPIPGFPAPPPTFTMPTLDIPGNTTLFLSVVEVSPNCPGRIPALNRVSLETTTVIYA
ncbi:hypothetical protein C8Q76DRAFT_829569 [Earliella scabrosa]|nr:hypothetical protein C8Q76DRAFT_829569 [Earliella scabrosa]